MSKHQSHYARELEIAMLAATEAGLFVRDYYDRSNAATYEKSDGSRVTDADLASDRVIRNILATHFPDDPILTEEGIDDPDRLTSPRCWICDPIDGTEQFIHRTDDFDVLIALVVDGRPVVAAAFNPPSGLLCAAEINQGAWTRDDVDPALRRFTLDPVGKDRPIRLATSSWFGAPDNRSLITRIGQRLNSDHTGTVEVGFTPRIFLPARQLDAYLGVRLGDDQAMAWEWDFAASDLFIREAGGMVSDLAGEPHRYNKPYPRSLNGLIAARDPATHGRLVQGVHCERQADRTAAEPQFDPLEA